MLRRGGSNIKRLKNRRPPDAQLDRILQMHPKSGPKTMAWRGITGERGKFLNLCPDSAAPPRNRAIFEEAGEYVWRKPQHRFEKAGHLLGKTLPERVGPDMLIPKSLPFRIKRRVRIDKSARCRFFEH